MKVFLSLLLTVLYSLCSGQSRTSVIDFSRIPQQKVRYLIENKMDDNKGLPCFAFQPTYRKGQNIQGYYRLESDFMLREDPEKVWQIYKATSPAESWNGSMVSFGLLVSKWSDHILYHDDKNFEGIDTGQVIIVNLRIMKGLYNLAVGLEIVDINPDEKSITYSYIKGGKSRGEQTIYFVPTKKGYTAIIHETAFEGDSFVRDRLLYPYFHRIAISEFHRNMRKSLQQHNKQLAQITS